VVAGAREPGGSEGVKWPPGNLRGGSHMVLWPHIFGKKYFLVHRSVDSPQNHYNNVATSRQILRLKCTKFAFTWGCALDSAGGEYSAPPDSLAGFTASCSICGPRDFESPVKKQFPHAWVEGDEGGTFLRVSVTKRARCVIKTSEKHWPRKPGIYYLFRVLVYVNFTFHVNSQCLYVTYLVIAKETRNCLVSALSVGVAIT